MLCGIPGTGTRLKGWSGPKLKANLDAVISLRFQSLQLKVSILTTILCMFMLLPLFVTTTCDPIELGLQSCINQQNLTDFEKTTIANVPALAFNPINSTTIVTINDTQTVILQPRQDPTTGWEWSVGLTGRYMSVVIAMALISYYSCCEYCRIFLSWNFLVVVNLNFSTSSLLCDVVFHDMMHVQICCGLNG